ncbi:MAG: hypothetical protein ABIO25_06275, partial [Specibacter sp.]
SLKKFAIVVLLKVGQCCTLGGVSGGCLNQCVTHGTLSQQIIGISQNMLQCCSNIAGNWLQVVGFLTILLIICCLRREC